VPGLAPEDCVSGNARSSAAAALLLRLCRLEAESRVCSPTVPAAGGFLEPRLGLMSQPSRFAVRA